MEDNNIISITICGDGGCGKSSLALRLVKGQWTSEYDPTIEDSYSVTRHIDGVPYQLHLRDTAGQLEYRALLNTTSLASDAFLLVYDITSLTSIVTLNTYFMPLVTAATESRLEQAAVPPVKILVGNKCDLAGRRQVEARIGLDWAREKGCGFMETSAREMVNVEETFTLIVRRVVEARKQHALAARSKATVRHQPAPIRELATPPSSPPVPTPALRAAPSMRALPAATALNITEPLPRTTDREKQRERSNASADDDGVWYGKSGRRSFVSRLFCR